MKLMNLISVAMLVCISLLLSCSEDEDSNTMPKPSSKYYIQFEADGELITFESDTIDYYATENLATCIVPPIDVAGNFAGIEMFNGSSVTPSDIESWEGKTFDFDNYGAVWPLPVFYYTYNAVTWGSDIADPSGSITYTKVTPWGELDGKKLYKLTGKFHGKINTVAGDSELTITNGRFVIGFSEGLGD